MQDLGCGWLARVTDGWNKAGVVPDWLVAQVAARAFDGLW